MNVTSHENSREILYIKCVDSPDLLRNLILLKVKNRENLTKNCVLIYYSSRFDEKFEIVECTKSGKLKGKSKNVPNHEN